MDKVLGVFHPLLVLNRLFTCFLFLPFSDGVVDSVLTHFSVIAKVDTFLFIVCTGFIVLSSLIVVER